MHRIHASFSLLILLLGILTLAGCSLKNKNFTLNHPGKYELTDLGKLNNIPGSLYAYKVHNKIFHVSTKTVHPSEYSVYLLEHTEIKEGESVLDIGTGSGVQAIFAAEKASHVLAMDISPDAIKDTAYNARRLGVSNKISVRESDIFNALKPDEKFDVIISGIPFVTHPSNQKNWKLQERFFREVGKHLNPNGRIYFSTALLRNMPKTQSLAEENGLKVVRINMDFFRVGGLEHVVYLFKQEKYAKWLEQDLVPQN